MFCKNCGTQIKEGGKFCPRCGAPVTGGDSPSPEAPKSHKTPKWAIPAAVLVLAAVLIVSISGILKKDKAESPTSGQSSSVQTAQTAQNIPQKAETSEVSADAPAKPVDTATGASAQDSSEDTMVEMDDPEIQKETAEDRESNDSLEMLENAEVTEDSQIYGNYDGYGETTLSSNVEIWIGDEDRPALSTIEAFPDILGENAPKSGYVISVTASNQNNIPCQIYPMVSATLTSPKYNYSSKSMLLLNTDAVFVEGGTNVSLEDPTYLKPVTVAPNEQRTFLYYLDLSGDSPVEMIDERLLGGFDEKLPLEDLLKHKEEITLDSETYLEDAFITDFVVMAADSAPSLKENISVTDIHFQPVDDEIYQVELTATNNNDICCDIFPMFGATATIVTDDWGREVSADCFVLGDIDLLYGIPYGAYTSLKVPVENFHPVQAFGLAPHESKQIIYQLNKKKISDITWLQGNSDVLHGDVQEWTDVQLLDFMVQEADVTYLPSAMLAEIEFQKDVIEDKVYDVIPLTNDTEDRWRELHCEYMITDEEGNIVRYEEAEAELIDLGQTAGLKFLHLENEEGYTWTPVLLYYIPDNSYAE